MGGIFYKTKYISKANRKILLFFNIVMTKGLALSLYFSLFRVQTERLFVRVSSDHVEKSYYQAF
jgi:hypothetical protein